MAGPGEGGPPPRLPSVTGIWFHSHQSATVTLAPIIMPVGIMNMLTTECSKPWAKKMKIDIQAQAILPMVEVVVMARTMARQTSQLHSIALTKQLTSPAKPRAE